MFGFRSPERKERRTRKRKRKASLSMLDRREKTLRSRCNLQLAELDEQRQEIRNENPRRVARRVIPRGIRRRQNPSGSGLTGLLAVAAAAAGVFYLTRNSAANTGISTGTTGTTGGGGSVTVTPVGGCQAGGSCPKGQFFSTTACSCQTGCSANGMTWTAQPDGSLLGRPICVKGVPCPQFVRYLPPGSTPPC